jgi:hypothetical protein
MKEHRNAILILISVILFIYAGLLSIYPAFLKSTFNVTKFEEKVYRATSLVTTIDSVDFKVKPNFDLYIYLYKWSSKYVDDQDCFDAGYIEITTGLFAPITKKFKIKNMTLKNVVFSNQLLMPENVNKLSYLPEAINPGEFGAKKFVVTPGPVTVKNFTIKYIAPNYYKENKRNLVEYSKNDVKEFLQKRNFKRVEIK